MSGMSATTYDGNFKEKNLSHWTNWKQSQQSLEHLCNGTVHFEVPIYLNKESSQVYMVSRNGYECTWDHPCGFLRASITSLSTIAHLQQETPTPMNDTIMVCFKQEIEQHKRRNHWDTSHVRGKDGVLWVNPVVTVTLKLVGFVGLLQFTHCEVLY